MSSDTENLNKRVKSLKIAMAEKVNKVKQAIQDYQHQKRTREESQSQNR